MVREAVEQLSIPHLLSEHGWVTVGVGVGGVGARTTGWRRAELIDEAADAALYTARHQGRNRVVAHGLIGSYTPPVSMTG